MESNLFMRPRPMPTGRGLPGTRPKSFAPRSRRGSNPVSGFRGFHQVSWKRLKPLQTLTKTRFLLATKGREVLKAKVEHLVEHPGSKSAWSHTAGSQS